MCMMVWESGFRPVWKFNFFIFLNYFDIFISKLFKNNNNKIILIYFLKNSFKK